MTKLSVIGWREFWGFSLWKSLSRVHLFATPWTAAHHASLSMEFSRQEYWSGQPFLSLGDLPDPENRTQGSCIGGRLFTIWATTEALLFLSVQFSSVTQSCPTLCDPWIAARQASLSITNSQSSLRLTAIRSVMPSSHLIFCRPLPLLPPIPPSIRVFSNESTLRMRWPNSSKPGILKEPI